MLKNGRTRCAAWAKRYLDEQPPSELPEFVTVPQPTLPIEGAHIQRSHGYVTPRRRGTLSPGFTPVSEGAAKAAQDFKRQAAGEQE